MKIGYVGNLQKIITDAEQGWEVGLGVFGTRHTATSSWRVLGYSELKEFIVGQYMQIAV